MWMRLYFKKPSTLTVISFGNFMKYLDTKYAKALLVEWFRKLQDIFNWRIVRGIGGLTILTRASYLALFLVPLLAGSWPGVRTIVNQHNAAIEAATSAMYTANLQLKDLMNQIHIVANNTENSAVNQAISSADKAADHLASTADQYAEDFERRALESPNLPEVFASTFFAALFVAVAHLIYQLGAPENVRSFTLGEFIKYRKRDYLDNKSSISLERARRYLGKPAGRRVTRSRLYSMETFLRGIHRETDEGKRMALHTLPVNEILELRESIRKGMILGPTSLKEEVLKLTDEILDPSKRAQDKERAPEHTLSLETSEVELGARAEYLHLASRNIVWILLSVLLYGASTALIASVLARQSLLVWNEAKLDSILDLFH